MKKLILSIILGFSFSAFADMNNWKEITNDFDIINIIESNPTWSDSVYAIVVGGSGGGGTTGAHLFSKGTSGSGGITGKDTSITYIKSFKEYEYLVNKGSLPADVRINSIYTNEKSIGILVDDFWISSELSY